MENIRGKLRYNRVRLVDVVPIGNEEYESNAIEYNHALAKLYLVLISVMLPNRIRLDDSINKLGFKIIEVGINVKSGNAFVTVVVPSREVHAKRSFEILQAQGYKRVCGGFWDCSKAIKLDEKEESQLRLWGLLAPSDNIRQVKALLAEETKREFNSFDEQSLQKLFDLNEWW